MDLLSQEFDLGGAHSLEPQRFTMETRVASYGPDGRHLATDVLRLELACAPRAEASMGTSGEGAAGHERGFQYTCLRFTLEQGDGPERAIPVLQGWTYAVAESGYDNKGQVFGIDHARFEGLADSAGASLPPDKSYFVYNAFIDFHSICDVFAQPAGEGNGIENLTRIGQRIVHAAAFSKAPVNLGSNVAEGSFFQNGEITLEFKGLSSANGRPCALIGYDSGESSFEMMIQATPEMKVSTVGRSHYWGDIHKNLATNWVEKADLTEAVVSETTIPGPFDKMDTYVERRITIRNVTRGN
jgi:hypothetical protein